MNYREKVMAYADILEIFSSEESTINHLLDSKIHNASHDNDWLGFWTEVHGRIQRRSLYQEIKELIFIEKKHLNHVEKTPNVVTLVGNSNTLKWLSMLYKYEEEVDYVLQYQKENGIMEKSNEAQSFKACIGALQFFNDAISERKSVQELFRYIPLVTWSIDALLVTKQMDSRFADFILKSFIPVLRAHKQACLVFYDLVENQEEYVKSEIEEGVGFKESTIFNREYQAEKISISVPPDPRTTNPDEEDPYLDELAHVLRNMFEHNRMRGPRVEQAERDWFFSPLTHLYRLRLHCDILGCTQSYVPVISPKLLRSASDRLYTHMKLYDERNLLESSILGIENVIEAARDTQYLEVYKSRFEDAYESLKGLLQDMLEAGLITSPSIPSTLERVRLRGEAVGLCKSDNY